MAEYRVTYVIDVEADSALDAAREAYECMVDPASMAPVLQVREILSHHRYRNTVLGPAQEFDLAEEG